MPEQQEFPLVSIILTYYNPRYLLEVLPLIFKNTDYPNYEIIVVENASPDSVQDFIAKTYPSVKYYKLPKNLGFVFAIKP